MTSWDDWCCPHPECDEGRTYSDPDTVRSTCCDRGHEVRLTWHGGEVQARLHYRGRRLVRGPLQSTLTPQGEKAPRYGTGNTRPGTAGARGET